MRERDKEREREREGGRKREEREKEKEREREDEIKECFVDCKGIPCLCLFFCFSNPSDVFKHSGAALDRMHSKKQYNR